jgi:hypothetical protein
LKRVSDRRDEEAAGHTMQPDARVPCASTSFSVGLAFFSGYSATLGIVAGPEHFFLRDVHVSFSSIIYFTLEYLFFYDI